MKMSWSTALAINSFVLALSGVLVMFTAAMVVLNGEWVNFLAAVVMCCLLIVSEVFFGILAD